MPATSVAVHDPSATSRSSTGEGADDRSLSVSSARACPEGVVPRNRSSATNRTVAFTPATDIGQKNNTLSPSEHVMIRNSFTHLTTNKSLKVKSLVVLRPGDA